MADNMKRWLLVYGIIFSSYIFAKASSQTLEVKRVQPYGKYLLVEDIFENIYLVENLEFQEHENIANGSRVFGAWYCPNCKYLNPYWNTACEKCHESKPSKNASS